MATSGSNLEGTQYSLRLRQTGRVNEEQAQFWLPGSNDVTAGVLRVDINNHIELDLIGCLEADRMPAGTLVGGFPRDLPMNADHHPLLRGVTRSNRFVTLVRVRGFAFSALRIANGVSTVRDFSGHASLGAEYLVEDWSEDDHPTFDSVEFEVPFLQDVISRSSQWVPLAQLPGVDGYVGAVTPSLPPMSVSLQDGCQITFRQVVRNGSDEVTVVNMAYPNRSSVEAFLPAITALRSLVELAVGSHQRVEGLVGIRTDELRQVFGIRHPIQGQPSSPLPRNQRGLRFRFGDLLALTKNTDVTKIASTIEADDPKRSELLTAWIDWFSHPDNADAILEILRPLHDQETTSNRILRQTVGVLEHLAESTSSANNTTRVSAPDPTEVAQRKSTIDAIRTLPDPKDGSLDWAVKRLEDGAASKGLARRISEILDSTKLNQFAAAFSKTLEV